MSKKVLEALDRLADIKRIVEFVKQDYDRLAIDDEPFEVIEKVLRDYDTQKQRAIAYKKVIENNEKSLKLLKRKELMLICL